MSDAGGAAVVVPWSTVWVTLVISFVVGLVFYAFFQRMYHKHAAQKNYTLFETRQFMYADRSPPPFEATSCLGWAMNAFRVSEEELLRCVGLDSYMFIRFLRLGFRVSLVGSILGCLILIPIYATVRSLVGFRVMSLSLLIDTPHTFLPKGEATGQETQEFNSITLAHVEQGSPRLWAAAVCWSVFIMFCLSEIDTEWLLYKPKRFDFLAKGDVDTERDYRYAVVVENIPEPLRSNHALRKYFQELFPGKVRQVNVLLHAEQLEKLVAERQAAIEACEKAVAFTHAKSNKPAPQVKVGGDKFGVGGTKVDAIAHFEDEITRLDGEIDKERAALCAFADSAHLQESTHASNLGSKLFSGLIKSNTEETAVDTAVTVGDEEKSDEKVVKKDGNANIKDDLLDIPRNESDEVGLLSDTDATDKPSDDTPLEGQTSSTGFVTFTSLRAKQAAIQCEISGKADDVDVAPAPIPTSMLWKNALTPLTTQRYVSMLATAVWLVGVLFWAVPVAFVTGIANLNSILQSFGISPLDPNTFYYGLISGILPVVALQLLMLVVYLSIGACATFGIRFKSIPEVDAYTFFWYTIYNYANLFLILVGGSLFNQIDALIKSADPGAFARLLATALPGASAFFLNMMLMGSFLMFGVELSMIASYGVKLVMNVIQPEAMKTQRMLDEEKKPPSIVWGKIVPPMIFIIMVAFVYMPIVPLMEPFACLYFGGWWLVWKHQCLHVYRQEFEGGGLLWDKIFGFVMACLYMAEVVVIAYLGLKVSLVVCVCVYLI